MYTIKGNAKYRIRRNAYIEGIYDNNEAEYASLLYSMNILEELGIKYEAVTLRGILKLYCNNWPGNGLVMMNI